MNGQQIQDAVVDAAHLLGYIAFHQRPARTTSGWRSTVEYDGKGFPDLVLAGGRGVMFLEIKGDGDRIRPDQRKWLDHLNAGEASARIVTSTDWRDGTVDRLLAQGGRLL
ncbi:MAG: VRR-NUC domain-containing protein [Acidimicrobiales bacterium]